MLWHLGENQRELASCIFCKIAGFFQEPVGLLRALCAIEEVPDSKEQGDDHYRNEKLPEEQHKQGEHDGRHRNDSFLFPCYDESSLFDKADESHSVTSI